MKLGKLSAILSLATLPVVTVLPAQTQEGAQQPPQGQPGQIPQGELPAAEIEPERILETYGFIVGLQSGIQEFNLEEEEFEAFLRGLRDAQAGEEMPEGLEAMLPQLQAYLGARQAAVVQERSRENRAEAEQFFGRIEEEEKGVEKSEEGLYYRIEEPGEGDRAGPNDRVSIHYEGRLLDGTVFDSSHERGEPVEFPVGGVIPGMAIGLQKIREGGKITLFVPPDLAYGDQSQPAIPPGSALIFEVELIEVMEGEEPGEALQPFNPQQAPQAVPQQ